MFRWSLCLVLIIACGDDSSPPSDGAVRDAATDSPAVDAPGVDAPPIDASPIDAPAVDAPTDASPPPDDRIGWAFESGLGLDTTTGGGDAEAIVVTTIEELDDAVDGDEPAVVRIDANMEGTVRIGSNKTIGASPGVVYTGALILSGEQNVILHDLTLVGYNCTDDACGDGEDTLRLFGAHHVWIDHCDISDGTDGNLDITAASDFVTVSWTRFSYSGRRAGGHQLSNLVGASDDAPDDVGRLNITWHHNHWDENIQERMPRVRYGRNHIFNNLYTSADNNYCVGLGVFGDVLLESNVFIGVDDPMNTTSYSNDESKLEARGNLYTDVTGDRDDFGSGVFTPPYEYTLDDADEVEALVRAGVGPR